MERECVFQLGKDSLQDVEKGYILRSLENEGYNRTRTAATLEIGIRTLQRKLKKWGLSDIGKPVQGGTKE